MKKISNEQIGETVEEKTAKFSGKRMSVSISDDDYNKLRDYCTAKGFTMSSFIVQKAMEAVNADILLNCMQSVVYYTAMYEKDDKPEILEKLSAYTSALEQIMGDMK